MDGYISSWKSGRNGITTCPGDVDVFAFSLSGVIDSELFNWLQQSGPFEDSGPCPGDTRVRFTTQSGVAVNIQRSNPQVSWQEF